MEPTNTLASALIEGMEAFWRGDHAEATPTIRQETKPEPYFGWPDGYGLNQLKYSKTYTLIEPAYSKCCTAARGRGEIR